MQFAVVVALTELSSYREVGCVCFDLIEPIRVCFNQDWCFQDLLDYSIKGVLCLFYPSEFAVLLGKVCQGFCEPPISLDELSVEVDVS